MLGVVMNLVERGMRMKFKKYVEGLNTFLKDNPESGELDVITSKDDEGMVELPPFGGFSEFKDWIHKECNYEGGGD